MDIKELRIGNLVTVENEKSWPQLSGVPIAVCGIVENTNPIKAVSFPKSRYCVKLYDNDRNDYNQFDEFIEPILLTEEWLLKFGFKKVKDSWITIESFHYENKNCWIYLIEKGFEFELITMDERNNLCKTYNYVHQLQNLYFAITGEELEYSNVTQHVKV